MNTARLQIKFNNSYGTFTVRQLIEELQKCENQDAPVTVYLLDAGANGEQFEYGATGRYPIHSVDDTFDRHRMVDLNIVASLEGFTSDPS
jgi:hypothetical protein